MADDPQNPGQNQADFDSAVNINDQLKNQVDNMRRLSTVRKEQLKISEQIVASAQALNTELLSQQDLIKEIQNLEGKRGELQKVQNNLAKDLLDPIVVYTCTTLKPDGVVQLNCLLFSAASTAKDFKYSLPLLGSSNVVLSPA